MACFCAFMHLVCWLIFETQDPEEWVIEHCETGEILW